MTRLRAWWIYKRSGYSAYYPARRRQYRTQLLCQSILWHFRPWEYDEIGKRKIHE